MIKEQFNELFKSNFLNYINYLKIKYNINFYSLNNEDKNEIIDNFINNIKVDIQLDDFKKLQLKIYLKNIDESRYFND